MAINGCARYGLICNAYARNKDVSHQTVCDRITKGELKDEDLSVISSLPYRHRKRRTWCWYLMIFTNSKPKKELQTRVLGVADALELEVRTPDIDGDEEQ